MGPYVRDFVVEKIVEIKEVLSTNKSIQKFPTGTQ